MGDTAKPVATELPPVTELEVTELLPGTELPPVKELDETELEETELEETEVSVTELELTKVKPHVGRPAPPIVCPTCNKVFKNRQEKYNHIKSGKCTVT